MTDRIADRMAELIRQDQGDSTPPHCDPRILHAPGVCQFCDQLPEWQRMRWRWSINFTGESDPDRAPCPADYFRGQDHQLWGGNRPGGYSSPQPELDVGWRVRVARVLRRLALRLTRTSR